MNNTCFMPKTNEASCTGFDISRYKEFGFVRSRLTFKLINYERNKERLKALPHRRFLDLAVSYCCSFKTAWGDNANILVTKDHLDFWGISEDELYKLALVNTPGNFGGKIEPLLDVVSRMTGIEDINEAETQEMYICTNIDLFYGASAILYEGFLGKFAREIGRSLIILPSSVHEVILLPDREESDYSALQELVDYVNKTEVAPNEILSDNVYKYDLCDDTIKLIYVTVL